MVTLAIWGEVTPGVTLTKCGMWGDMVDVITCAIFGDCRLRGVGVVRGVSLPSPIDLTRRPYNTGHTTIRPCDRVILQVDHEPNPAEVVPLDFFFFSYACHEPKLVSHKTVSSSAECSRDKPPFSFVMGQDSTM